MTEHWQLKFDNSTTKFINSKPINKLLDDIKKECEYKEEIINDYYENQTIIYNLEKTDDSFINNLRTLFVVHLYRDEYFKVLEDMEDNIRNMFIELRQHLLNKFPYNKADVIYKALVSFI
jgi:hypothetical protein